MLHRGPVGHRHIQSSLVRAGQGFATLAYVSGSHRSCLQTLSASQPSCPAAAGQVGGQNRDKKKPHQTMDSEASSTNRSKSWLLLTAASRLGLRTTETENVKTGMRASTTGT